MRTRLGDCSQKIITVADRESDFYEFLHELIDADEAFVIRAKHDRYTGKTHRARGQISCLAKCPILPGKITLASNLIIGRTSARRAFLLLKLFIRSVSKIASNICLSCNTVVT